MHHLEKSASHHSSLQGDTVNVASRMESTGKLGRIQITSETADILARIEDNDEFSLEERGPIMVKGKGELTTFLVRTAYDSEEEMTHV